MSTGTGTPDAAGMKESVVEEPPVKSTANTLAGAWIVRTTSKPQVPTMITSETTVAGSHFPRKSMRVSSLINDSIRSDLIGVFAAIRPKISFVTTRAVYMLTIMPPQSVMANPRIGPEPNTNRITPVISVVRFESRIARNARS